MRYIQREFHLFKIVFALFICILFYVLIGEKNYETILIACYASIFGIQARTTDIFVYGLRRLAGTMVGGGLAIGYIYLYRALSKSAHVHYLLLLIPVIILIASMLVGGFQKRSAAVMGVALTVVTMSLMVLESNQFEYFGERMIATVVGVVSSVIVNIIVHLIRSKRHKKDVK